MKSLKSGYGCSNHCALGGGQNFKKNGRMLCDERYVFEDKDVEVVFEITNEHMTAVLRPNSLSRL